MEESVKEPKIQIDEMDVIFDEEKVGDYIIKSWTLKQLRLLWPLLAAIAAEIKAMGATADNLDTFLLDHGIEIIGQIVPQAAPFLSISLNISEEEADNLDFAQATLLITKVIAKNIEHLKNFSGQAFSLISGTLAGIR